MKKSYIRQRDAAMVDYEIDLRPEHIKAQVIPVFQMDADISKLEIIFENLKSK